MAKRALGKGLDSLISNKLDREIKETVEKKNTENVSRETLQQEALVKLSLIDPNRGQPRTQFDEDALKELADSIRLHGVIQPLVVQKRGERYEIIAGERRFRAARMAGLAEVPVLVREYGEQELYEIALIENLQREDLNAIEEAVAYKKLIEEYDLKQEQVAERVSKSRTAVANTLRLLRLDETVQQMIYDGRLSAGHARTLLALEREKQTAIAERIIRESLSVRDTETLVKKLQREAEKEDTAQKGNEKEAAAVEAIYRKYEDRLRSVMGTKVSIVRKPKNKGKIEIEYYSLDEFERIMQLLQVDPY